MAESPITAREKDFAAWYQDVVMQGDMAEPAEIVKGCMVIKPNGYAVWEHIQRELDDRIKATGHSNIYLPLLIPQSFLQKEAEHVEGFSPELAVVTIAGGKELEEPYVIRPTSETIVGHFFKRWIQSYRDLPLLINQWANVMRWEMRTRMFLRTTEFLWQEGHTAHASHEEALEEVLRMLDVYGDVAENVMAMPVIKGVKTQRREIRRRRRHLFDRSHDAERLRAASGHQPRSGPEFRQSLRRARSRPSEGKLDYVWQTSWGMSTRLIGALIMTHSDDKGLVLPPKLAPRKAVIVPIYRKDEERAQVMEAASKMAADLGAHLDDPRRAIARREILPLGAARSAGGLRTGPARRGLRQDRHQAARYRDQGSDRAGGMPRRSWPPSLEPMQTDLLTNGRQRLKDNTVLANSIEEVEEILRPVTAEKGGGKFVMAHIADNPANDERVKAFKASIRNIPLVDEYDGPGKCILTGERWTSAR